MARVNKAGSRYDETLSFRFVSFVSSLPSHREHSQYDETIRNGRKGRVDLDSIPPSRMRTYQSQQNIVMDDERLIEAVRGFPCLWRVSCRAYRDIRAKENFWKEVALVSILHIVWRCRPFPSPLKMGKGRQRQTILHMH